VLRCPSDFARLVTVGEGRRRLVTRAVRLAKAKVAGSNPVFRSNVSGGPGVLERRAVRIAGGRGQNRQSRPQKGLGSSASGCPGPRRDEAIRVALAQAKTCYGEALKAVGFDTSDAQAALTHLIEAAAAKYAGSSRAQAAADKRPVPLPIPA
jgi:hypothetical protein